MFRIVLVFTVLLLANVANAQPVIDLGQDDVLKGEDATKKDSKVVEEAKDSRGIFSFMNFSFGQKEEKTALPEGETLLSHLTKKADDGDVDSQIMLGYLYLYGDAEKGVEQNQEKSFYYYSLAAKQDDKIAVNNLGSLYYSGIGTERSTVKAAEMFEKAVSLGNNEAAVNLAFIYLTGMGLPKNYGKAMSLFTVAAEDGNPTAKFMLGYAYYRGFSVKKDHRKAFALMRDAASSKYDDAQYILARMYMYGEGTTKNYGNAVKYMSAAAKQGNVAAMMDLGDILVNGVIYNQNLYEAHIWFNVASVYGAPNAAQKRDALEGKGGKLKLEELLNAQSQADLFVEKPSEVTVYIRETFGESIRSYIDDAITNSKGK